MVMSENFTEIKEQMEKEEEFDEMIESEVEGIKIKNKVKKLTQEEKLALLSKYLNDEVFIKSITETLSPKELNDFIELNLEEMVLKVGV